LARSSRHVESGSGQTVGGGKESGANAEAPPSRGESRADPQAPGSRAKGGGDSRG
jgi:hypothetical protein